MPFGFTDTEYEDYAVLLDGVPAWMREPLIGWLEASHLTDGSWVRTAAALQLQTVTRIDLGVPAGAVMQMANLRPRLRKLPEKALLRVIDYMLSVTGPTPRSTSWQQLETILQSAKSKWTVGQRMGKVGLIERVPAGVQAAVEGTIASSGTAGTVLARAWSYVHGLEPNDSSAYADAVRAVEIAAIAVVQPNHGTATLGTVLGQMRADGDWRLPLREHQQTPTADLVLGMLQTLWYGHRDRHGSVDYSDVTHDEARAAVALAATLTEWFTSGALTHRP